MMWLRTRLFADSGLLRRRGAALVLALTIELLLAMLLFFLAPPLPDRKKENRTTVFGIEASKSEETAEAKPAEKRRQKAARSQQSQASTPPPPPPVPLPLETPAPVGPPTFLKLSRNDYQQGDISRVPTHSADASAANNEVADADGAHADDSPIVGKAPNGEPMYAPGGWVRKPTNAELEPYRPHRVPNGTGTIACRTAPRNRLVGCRILGETPPGSGFGYASLQASWQFQMRPPRLGGKEQIGVWVIVTGQYTTTEK